jgi:predicted PolB exonuclease-like 3'-5' exonuclease
VLKGIAEETWCFDAEWVPDPATGRRTYDLPPELNDERVVEHMWEAGGATPQNPRPYLKTVLCRVLSIAAVQRTIRNGVVCLAIKVRPQFGEGTVPEAELLDRFFRSVGQRKPQLVGFNSVAADLPILVQRALVNGLMAPEFCSRPNKPWEGVDYFARHSEAHIDLKSMLGGWRDLPSLHELATACGVPGKVGVDGASLIDMWRAGDIDGIAEYNVCDAATTFLLWLRAAHFCGYIDTAQMAAEETLLRAELQKLGRSGPVAAFLRKWTELSRR